MIANILRQNSELNQFHLSERILEPTFFSNVFVSSVNEDIMTLEKVDLEEFSLTPELDRLDFSLERIVDDYSSEKISEGINKYSRKDSFESTTAQTFKQSDEVSALQDFNEEKNIFEEFQEINVPTKFDRLELAGERNIQTSKIICQMIDRKSLRLLEFQKLKKDQLIVLSNFTFLMFGHSINLTNSTEAELELLNEKIVGSIEKKKRNEERIKYVFKRVNQLILSKVASDHNMEGAPESRLLSKMLEIYFPQVSDFPREVLINLISKPSNLYRTDLKKLFNNTLYKDLFNNFLQEELLISYESKRLKKIQSYIRDLQDEIFFNYSTSQQNSNLLQNRITRMPWSLSEIRQGISLLRILAQ